MKRMKILTGTFEKGCGVIVCDTVNDEFYHQVVLDKGNGCYIVIGGKKYYKDDLDIKEV